MLQNRYQEVFRWLEDAGVALPCYNVTEPQPPLQLNENHSLFKLFMNDTGLLCAACMENVQFAILNGDVTVNLGSILENMAAQQFRCNGFHLNYYDSKRMGEIDFVIQNGMKIHLVEIKSGNDYKKHLALEHIRAVAHWKFDKTYVFCKGNVEADNDVIYLPWYYMMFFRPDELPKGMKYEVDITALSEKDRLDC